MFARFDKMSKTFTKYGKEIAIAVKSGGTDPESNAKLRAVIANAKSQNMPKDRIEAAIKRSAGKDTSNYEEIAYEAMCMKGVGLVIETATDNPTRTVANIRMHLNRGGGELGKSGCLDFAFDRKSVFVISTDNINADELELELIDAGCDEIEVIEDKVFVYGDYTAFGTIAKALEDMNIEVQKSNLQRIPTSPIDLTEEQMNDVEKLLDKIEDDDDIQQVFTNIS